MQPFLEWPMRTFARPVVFLAAALAAAGMLAGCSSSSSSDSSSSQAGAASSAASPIGGNVLPPVMVEPGQTEATAKVGDTIVFNIPEADLAGTTIDTDQPDILEVSQAKQEGDALFNPGAKALAPGTAVVTITAPDMKTSDVTITVTE